MKAKKKNLKVNITNFYIGLTLFFVIGFVFFSTSKLFLAEEIPINQTELNVEYDLRSKGKFEINSWIYDENKERMEIVLVTNGIKDYKTNLSFSSVTKENINKELPINIVYSDNEIYVIEINNVKRGFEQIALRLHRSEKNIDDIFDYEIIEENKKNELFSTIYTDERVVNKKELIEKSEKDYAEEITNELIKQTKEKIKLEENFIAKRKEIIDTLSEEIFTLEEELLYQTIDEQIETSNQIYRMENELEGYKKEIDETEINIKNLETKIERLEQKKRDLKM